MSSPKKDKPMEILPIRLPLPFRIGYVNCYLLSINSSFILIDSGGSNSRKHLVKEIEQAGCLPGQLKLIILTHGDFDHTGNAAYLRNTYGAKIAMHPADAGMVENGDMFINRSQPNFLIKKLIPLFTGFGKAERFSPDILLQDGEDLRRFGLDAELISIPGHSKGSIGLITSDHDLFCGDLLENVQSPGINSIMDNLPEAEISLESLGKYSIQHVYPGHGEHFHMDRIK